MVLKYKERFLVFWFKLGQAQLFTDLHDNVRNTAQACEKCLIRENISSNQNFPAFNEQSEIKFEKELFRMLGHFFQTRKAIKNKK